MASMSHFEAEREAARADARMARTRRERRDAPDQKIEATEPRTSAPGPEARADALDPDRRGES
jgi:hypothetical protein